MRQNAPFWGVKQKATTYDWQPELDEIAEMEPPPLTIGQRWKQAARAEVLP